MLEQAEESTTQRLIGQFESETDAQAALARLVELGIAPEAVTLTRVVADAPPTEEELPVDPLKSGAATGAVLGGLLGALAGWMLSIGALALPGVGRVEGAGTLSTLLAGLGLGALVGGLIGALVGVGIPKRALSTQHSALSTSEGPLYMTVEAPLLLIDSVETALIANGALEVQGAQLPSSTLALPLERSEQEEATAPSESTATLNPSTSSGQAFEPGTLNSGEEDTIMSDMSDSDKGRDPNTVTGTTDAIDPETGALGTGGTPLTTGYGVSGSTVGTGTSQGREESEAGEPGRPTPDATTYDRGGRGSDDEPAQSVGSEHSVPTEVKYGPVPGEDTSGEEMPQGGDLYTRSPSYGGDTANKVGQTPTTGTGSEAQESAGTNIPGTEDPRGLGDNTDG